jgi:hypothetical protein
MRLSEQEFKEIVDNCVNPGCTRIGWGSVIDPDDIGTLKGTCVGYHCPFCGEPCSYYGHPNCDKEEEVTKVMNPEEVETVEVDAQEYEYLLRMEKKYAALRAENGYDEGRDTEVEALVENDSDTLELSD